MDVDPPKVITYFKMEGNFRGTLCTEIGSNTAVLGEGGILQGDRYGIITSKDGQGMTTWRGQGKGKFTGPGKVGFRGSVFLKIPPVVEGGKLSILNNMVGVFEYETDENGNCSSKTWEWK